MSSRQEAAHTSSTGAPPVPVVAATSVEVDCTSTSTSMRVFAIAGYRDATAPAVDMKLKGDGQVWVEKIHADTSVDCLRMRACVHACIPHVSGVIAYHIITSLLHTTVATSRLDNLTTQLQIQGFTTD